MAYDAQKQAFECDDKEGIISHYLEKLAGMKCIYIKDVVF